MINLVELNNVIKIHSDNVKNCHIELKRLDSNSIYQRNIKSKLSESYAQIGHAHYKNMAYDLALKFYKKAIIFNPCHLQALNQIGLILMKIDNYELAISHFEKIISTANNPRELIHKVDAILNIALVYIKTNRNGDIRRAYKQIYTAEALYPEYPLIKEIKKQLLELTNGEIINYSNRLVLDEEKRQRYMVSVLNKQTNKSIFKKEPLIEEENLKSIELKF